MTFGNIHPCQEQRAQHRSELELAFQVLQEMGFCGLGAENGAMIKQRNWGYWLHVQTNLSEKTHKSRERFCWFFHETFYKLTLLLARWVAQSLSTCPDPKTVFGFFWQDKDQHVAAALEEQPHPWCIKRVPWHWVGMRLSVHTMLECFQVNWFPFCNRTLQIFSWRMFNDSPRSIGRSRLLDTP